MDFPLFKTKTENCTKNYNLTDPRDQADYFECKAGKEISALKSFMQKNTFIVYLLGKKIPVRALIPKYWRGWLEII